MLSFSGQDSTLSDWISYNVSDPWAPSTCQFFDATTGITSDIGCSQICNDSVQLFDSQLQKNNLQTCGVWTTLVSAYTYLSPHGSFQFNGSTSVMPIFEAFGKVGLDATVYQYTPTYTDTISACLAYIWVNVKENSFSDDDSMPEFCSEVGLFLPFGSNTNVTDYTESSLWGCLNAICAPVTLNPDLAGVGVTLPSQIYE